MTACLEKGHIHHTFAGYSRHFWSGRVPRHHNNQLTWANRWYTPSDLRHTTPVQSHKFAGHEAHPDDPKSVVPSHWVPMPEAPLASFSRAKEEKHMHSSAPSSRSEEWSTLRQLLPSAGHCVRQLPPKWGTRESVPPTWCTKKPRRFPHINSPMTGYVDDIHVGNRLFRMH